MPPEPSDLFAVVGRRRSVRGFHPDRPVPRVTLERIFAAAQRAPSWCNIQPWRVVVTSGAATRRLTERLLAAAAAGAPEPDVPFPFVYPEPYKQRRLECAVALYGAMGVARGDGAGRHAAWMRNYAAFDAPHVAIVSMDRRFGLYAALDVGCWLGTLLLAATAEGVATCPAASLATFPQVLREELAIPDGPDGEQILFGVALGYEDEAVAANRCVTTREPLSANVRFVEA
jgi:nitroreductase